MVVRARRDLACRLRGTCQRVEKEIGKVDLLVNNAGIIIRESMSSPNAAANWRKTIDVNLNGTFNVTLAWLPRSRRPRARSSTSLRSPRTRDRAQASAIRPPRARSRCSRSRLRRSSHPRVRVNALAPGVIETPMTEATRQNPARLQSFMTRIPMGRVGQTEDLVGPVIFLACDMSRYVTGITLPVDGGFLAV